MDNVSDHDLLREFAASQSEPAFATLVRRHLNLVYSSALRQVRDPHQAEEIAQVVFLILARKAGRLGNSVVLPGWLVRTTRFAAANALRNDHRRKLREQEAYMQSTLNEPDPHTLWEQLAPALDEAVSHLRETDRNAIILRYLQGKNLQEVGLALGMTEDTTRKRVARSLEKLRKFFTKRGTVAGAGAMAAALSVNTVQAAPPALAATITSLALAKTTVATGTTLSLLKTTLKIMAWTKTKTIAATTVAVLLLGGTATVAVKHFREPAMSESLWRANSSAALVKMPKTIIIRPTKYPDQSGYFGTTGHLKGLGQPLESLVGIAYHTDRQRIEFPPDLHPKDLPEGKFDFLLNPPDNGEAAFRDALQKQFGLIAHKEKREKDILVLKVRTPDGAGLKPSTNFNGSSSYSNIEQGFYHVTLGGCDMRDLARYLEHFYKSPINDATGLTRRYDLNLKWRKSDDAQDTKNIDAALSEELGLELIPANETVEVLVVERVKR